MSWTAADFNAFITSPGSRSVLSEGFRDMLENPHTMAIPLTDNDKRVAQELGLELQLSNRVDMLGECYFVHFPDAFPLRHEMLKNIESNKAIIRAATVTCLLMRHAFSRNLTPFERRTLKQSGYTVNGFMVEPPPSLV